jgi:hypothetical protein
MNKNSAYALLVLLILPLPPLFGGTGSPPDGALSFLVVLGFLGLLLGIIQLAECLPQLLDKIIDRKIGDITPSSGAYSVSQNTPYSTSQSTSSCASGLSLYRSQSPDSARKT